MPKRTKSSEKAETPKTIDELRTMFRKQDGDRPHVIYEEDSDRVRRIPTRFPKLNALLGGGIQEGSIVEIYGPEDSGKSTGAIALAADVQRQAPKDKRHVVLVNYEGPQPWPWWRTIGLDTHKDAFTQLRPKDLEQGIARLVRLIETGMVCACVIDSVYSADSREGREMLKKWEDPKVKGAGLSVEARQWGKAWTSMKGLFQDYGVVCIAVNQEREVIDVNGAPMRSKFRGPKPTTSPRGKALKFYAWVRMIAKAWPLDREKYDLKKVDGITTRWKVIKNKTTDVARGSVHYALIRGKGYDLVDDLIDICLDHGVIKGGGGGNFVLGSKRVRGRDNLHRIITDSPTLQARLTSLAEGRLAKAVREGGGDEGDDDGDE